MAKRPLAALRIKAAATSPDLPTLLEKLIEVKMHAQAKGVSFRSRGF